MNENAKKWVKALRSGEYEQGVGQLRDRSEFCCLGVACELAISAGIITLYDGNGVDLPTPVEKWLGLASPYGEMADSKPLTDLNDEELSFPQIADLIEAEPEGLFA